uniref:Uncharacterized protein n=1 Tax=Lepeophtheirus salmonis TaxID=72036 RepID=A0A0K2T7F2_LEPSM
MFISFGKPDEPCMFILSTLNTMLLPCSEEVEPSHFFIANKTSSKVTFFIKHMLTDIQITLFSDLGYARHKSH